MPFLDPSNEPELDALLAACSEAPSDRGMRLVLADWLEEHDDPRAELYRLVDEERPIDKWLRRHGIEWLGNEGRRGLRVEKGKLVADSFRVFDPGLFDAIDQGWVDAANLSFIDRLTKPRPPARLSDVRLYGFGPDSADLKWIAQLPSLRSFSCEGATNVTATRLAELAAAPNLEEINLSQCVRLSSRAVAQTLRFPALRKLAIAGSRELKPVVLDSLTSAKALREIDVSNSRWLDDAGAARFVDLPELRSLDLSW